MHIVVVGAPDHDSTDVRVGFSLLIGVDLLEVREGLENGLPIVVIFSLLIGPLIFDQLRALLWKPRVSVHHPC